ncbi:MAG: hypothetical protein LCH84_14615 [Gemmatimonadetes bacterium]|nr:hypothetical protein [Gemmatimonadota bacterium]
MPSARRLLVAAIAFTAVGTTACHRVASRPPAGGEAAVGPRPVVPGDKCDPRNPSASLTGRVMLTFTGASSGEAVIRIEGPEPRATVRVPVAEGTLMELREGRYILHIAVNGYRSVDQPVAVVCGKDINLPVPLSRR